MTQPYRRSVEVDRDKDYYIVHLGAIAGSPEPSSYPFPTLGAAAIFADTHARKDPGRDIVIEYPDGRKWNGQEFVA